MYTLNLTPSQKLKNGLDKVANSVKVTIGPLGRNVAIESGIEPIITNDGGTIANYLQLEDKTENLGAQIIRGVIRKTSEKVGGGRTASAILTQAIVTEGLKQLENGMNMSLLKAGMTQAVSDITKGLKKNSVKVTSKEQLRQIATISTESAELGETIADVVYKVGKDTIVTIEDSQTFGITSEIVDGIKFDRGYISPYMVTNERLEAELKDTPVLVTDKKITIFKEIMPVIEKLVDSGKNSLVLICEDFEGDALNNAVIMKMKGVFNLLAIKAPIQDKSEWLEDIAVSVGTQVVSEKTGLKFDTKLGIANKVISTKDSTVLMGKANILDQLKKIEIELENAQHPWEKDKLERRKATLQGHVAVIKVGAATESELKYLKQKIEDGVNESKRALEEGIVIGGDCAYLKVKTKNKGVDEFFKGYNIILKAIEAPLRQIVINGNGKPDLVIEQVKNSGKTQGYNVLTNKLTNMFKAGVIDALKVTRTTLENALSGAFMYLTISVAITNEEDNGKQRIEY